MMRKLTDAGRGKVGDVARQNDVSSEAATNVLEAIVRGGGTQAQFSHPDLGGMGQWSRGGMIMIGDMFNSALKARVDHLCTDLSALLTSHDLFAKETSDSDGGDRQEWWPDGCGRPASSGSQNDMRYAYFPETSRLAIERAGVVSLYDTGDHRISGVSQQQSGTQDLAFTSQHGPIKLHELTQLDGDASRKPETKPAARLDSAKSAPAQSDDVFATIERLHGLQQKGVISDADFAEKKKELLARL